ncbi:MAG: hypothetical protein QW775_01270 [Ignisphaera sp.]|uniref:Uncharacterized protein n=1 Tax=Ignisphaera aggregans TaxID=334771 RepID=A0A7C4JKS3_9CREN
MSLFVKRFGVLLSAVVFIMLGLDIIVLYHNLSLLPLTVSMNLIVVGFLVLLRGFVESNKSDRRFYLAWALLLMNIASSIIVASSLGNNIIGLAVFLIGLGVVMLFVSLA